MWYYQLREEDGNKQISALHLEDISLNSCRKWRLLPSRLGLKEIVVHDINRSFVDEEERRRAFFLKWREIKGSGVTYKALISALLEIKCREDAESVCKLLQQQSLSEASWQQPLLETSRQQLLTASGGSSGGRGSSSLFLSWWCCLGISLCMA